MTTYRLAFARENTEAAAARHGRRLTKTCRAGERPTRMSSASWVNMCRSVPAYAGASYADHGSLGIDRMQASVGRWIQDLVHVGGEHASMKKRQGNRPLLSDS
ncbi:hypothetical protein ACFY5D_21885 [Paeniglutamicibacter sp. NPDC012692]|uniref:hypothetical protein n=1 Tax=Paeniglutamicibacter sp. NPDC012692 TaxID=3364388 RepID=UPI00368DE347